MIKSLDILNDTWELRYTVGKGAFCELIVGKNIIDDDQPLVAIKLANSGIDSGIIRWEAEVLKGLSDLDVVPKLLFKGEHEGQDYIVMDLLGGEDMASLRDRIRQTSGSGLLSIPAASFLARQMLYCIKSMHLKGYIHRDVKPANFVRKSQNSRDFCIIDFGITKMVICYFIIE